MLRLGGETTPKNHVGRRQFPSYGASPVICGCTSTLIVVVFVCGRV